MTKNPSPTFLDSLPTPKLGPRPRSLWRERAAQIRSVYPKWVDASASWDTKNPPMTYLCDELNLEVAQRSNESGERTWYVRSTVPWEGGRKPVLPPEFVAVNDLPYPLHAGGFSPWPDRVEILKANPGKWVDMCEYWGLRTGGSNTRELCEKYGVEVASRKVDGVRHHYVRYVGKPTDKAGVLGAAVDNFDRS